jgi:hypothetical protein
VPAEELLHRCAGLLGIPIAQLTQRRKDAASTRLRHLVAGVGIERWQQRPAELARRLGRSPEAVGRWAKRAGALRMSDEGFRADYEALDAGLAVSFDE